MKDLAEMSTTPLKGGDVGTYPFGISVENTAVALRYLADMFDHRQAVASVVKIVSTAKRDDYIDQTFILRFTAKRKEAAPNAGRNNPAPPPGAWTLQDDDGAYTHGYASHRVRPGYLDAPFSDEAAALWWQSEAAKEYLKLRESI